MLAKVDVEGSNPFARSILSRHSPGTSIAAGRGGSSNWTREEHADDGTPGGSGGGVCAAGGGAATALSSLVAQNRAGTGGSAGTWQYGNPGVGGTNGVGSDLVGAWSSAGHNLVGAGEGSPVAPVSLPAGFGFDLASVSLAGLPPGVTYHFRTVATNAAGTVYGPDQTFTTAPFFAAGDFDGDGAVNQDELKSVYSSYWQGHPTVITNALGLGTEDVRLKVENSIGWDLSVQVSTNLATWTDLPERAIPVFQFADPDASNGAVRFYRLVAP